jgi:hypothetical protein
MWSKERFSSFPHIIWAIMDREKGRYGSIHLILCKPLTRLNKKNESENMSIRILINR